MPKVTAIEVRPGNIVEHQKKLWRVLKTEHVKPGKGGAFCQMEMKELKQGTKLNERFRSSETLELVRLDLKDYQFLYNEGENIVLMDPKNYDQMTIPRKLLGEQAVFLQDGMKISLEASEHDIISARVPDQVVLAITETEAVVRGQTAASSNKPAMLENGVRVMVPPFINAGDRVVINTADVRYIERAKE